MDDTLSIRNVSDTAAWVAMYRAAESNRPGALFHDPYARRLAGERGEQSAHAMRSQDKYSWAFVARTVLFDSLIRERLANGVDMIINLAAGLDARPYRMDVPSSLRWVEVDLPDMIRYKESVLRNDNPRCRLERVTCDLADGESRRALFNRLGAESTKALVLSEGLLIYMDSGEAARMADDLSAQRGFRWWVFDITSPPLVKMMQKEVGATLERANAPYKFFPIEGPWFFEPHGWRVVEVRGTLKSAAKLLKLPLMMRFYALMPEAPRGGKQPWSGTCLLENMTLSWKSNS
jgi:methyltransferase (TIGR00027 family)